METGTILEVNNHGTLIELVLRTDDDRVVRACGETRLTAIALEGLFPEGVVAGESRVDFAMEDWGGLASIAEASS